MCRLFNSSQLMNKTFTSLNQKLLQKEKTRIQVIVYV